MGESASPLKAVSAMSRSAQPGSRTTRGSKRSSERVRKRLRRERIEMRQSPENGNLAERPDDALVLGMRLSHERDAEQGDRPAAQCLDRQERVIDGAEARARAQDHRRAPGGDDLDQQRLPSKGHHEAARPLDDERPLRGR